MCIVDSKARTGERAQPALSAGHQLSSLVPVCHYYSPDGDPVWGAEGGRDGVTV